MLADQVSIVVAEVPAVAVADPTRESGRAMLVAVASPIVGVTKVGLVVNATVPDPASSVNADARFAEDGVARNVATPVPRPEIPVDTGRPVALVSVRLVGVPKLEPFGTVTVPVNVGLAIGALASICVWIADVTPFR